MRFRSDHLRTAPGGRSANTGSQGVGTRERRRSGSAIAYHSRTDEMAIASRERMNHASQPEEDGSNLPGGRRPHLFVGRQHERRLLRAQLDAAMAGSGSIVLFAGEAGIGKSRLAEWVCQEAAASGMQVLVGHCYDSSETPPYGPWTELIEQVEAGLDRPLAERELPVPDLVQASSQAATYSEMRAFLASIAGEQPLVLLLEDVHWADTESLGLLRFIARRLASAPIVLLVTYRNDEVTRDHPLHRLVPMLVREALAVRIDVAPLGDVDVRALIDGVYALPNQDASRLTAYLQRRAEGNPFFISELLRSLEATVLRPDPAGRWTLGSLDRAPLPLLLRQVIDQRLARLGPGAETVLAVAAVIGQLVPFELWAQVAEVPEEELLPVVELAIASNMMEATADGTAARFTHALIRDSIYESVLPPRRRAQHLRIASVLTSGADPDPDEVAHHFRLAGDRRAVEWLTRAGERAQAAFAWRTAAQRFAAALEMLESDPSASNERGWLQFRLALLGRFEDPRAGVSRLQDAERLGRLSDDRALAAYARFFQGMLRCQGDDFRLGIAAEEAGIEMLDALSSEERARLQRIDTTSDPLDPQNGRGELTLALAENGRLHQARALGEHLVGQPAEQTYGSRADAWYGLGYAYSGLGMPDAASDAFGNARQIFAADDYRSMVAASLFDELTIVTFPYWADRPQARQRIETALSEALALLDDMVDQRSAGTAGVVSAVLAGEWTDAGETLRQSGLRFMQRAAPLLLAPIARHQGNADLAWTQIRESFPSGSETRFEDFATDAFPLGTLAVELALDAGETETARNWLVSLERWLDWSGSLRGRADAALCWAGYHRATGDLVQAREWAVRALSGAESPRQPLTLLAAHRLMGELDRAEGNLLEAERRFIAALELAEACRAQHERALTCLSIAELALLRGDLATAREQIATVRELCTPMQATRTLAQADALQARLPASSPGDAVKPAAGLTRRELEVVRLLAMGLPNAEIAQQLSLSPRTVDTHLTSIYGKLGVTSRGAAIRFALEHDLD